MNIRRRKVFSRPGSPYAYVVEDADDVLNAQISGALVDSYAFEAWPCGRVLARWLPAFLMNRGECGTTVFDVGAGTGILSLALASHGYKCTAFEHDPVARSWIEDAAREQGFVVETRADLSITDLKAHRGIVVLSDMFYEDAVIDFAVRITLSALRHGCMVVSADPYRKGYQDYLERVKADFSALDFHEETHAYAEDGQKLQIRVGLMHG